MNETRVDQQLEVLGGWWEENGKRVLTGIITVVALGVGWTQWGSWQERQTEQASDIYQSLLETLQNEESDALSPGSEARETLIQLANSLREEFPSSIYAQYGSLLEAKQAVEEGDLRRAEDALQWILIQEPDQIINAITYLRLARVAWARGDRQSAQQYLLTPESGYFIPLFQELRGDMLWDFGIPDQARQAYSMAAQSYGDTLPDNLRFKIQEIESIVASKSAEGSTDAQGSVVAAGQGTGGDAGQEAGGDASEEAGGDASEEVGSDASEEAGGDASEEVGSDASEEAFGDEIPGP